MITQMVLLYPHATGLLITPSGYVYYQENVYIYEKTNIFFGELLVVDFNLRPEWTSSPGADSVTRN